MKLLKWIPSFLILLSSYQLNAETEFERVFRENYEDLTQSHQIVKQSRDQCHLTHREHLECYSQIRTLEKLLIDHFSDYFRQLFIPPNIMVEYIKSVDELDRARTACFEKHVELCDAMQRYSESENAYRMTKIRPLVDRYSWAIPNDEAIDTISSYSPLIELGAGSGYWSHLLAERGADIRAYDDFSWQTKHMHDQGRKWYDVQVGTEQALLLPENLDRTLLISWPPKTHFAFDALELYKGEFFIYVGELPEDVYPSQPAMASSPFFFYLTENFNEVRTIDIPQWPGYSDRLHIFKRKPQVGTIPTSLGSSSIATAAASDSLTPSLTARQINEAATVTIAPAIIQPRSAETSSETVPALIAPSASSITVNERVAQSPRSETSNHTPEAPRKPTLTERICSLFSDCFTKAKVE